VRVVQLLVFGFFPFGGASFFARFLVFCRQFGVIFCPADNLVVPVIVKMLVLLLWRHYASYLVSVSYHFLLHVACKLIEHFPFKLRLLRLSLTGTTPQQTFFRIPFARNSTIKEKNAEIELYSV
jgi:hypothetical protein